MSMKIVIITKEPPDGIQDYAPKEFAHPRQVATILGILSDAMNAIVKEEGGRTHKALQYAGRDVVEVRLQQWEDRA